MLLKRPIYISLLLLATTSNSIANNDKKLELFISEYETNFNYAMPIGDNHRWKLDIGYHDEQFDDSEKMTKREGKISTEMKKKNYFLSTSYSWTFQNGVNLSLGGDYEHYESDMKEWGLYNETVRGSAESLTFENNIEIEGERFSLTMGIEYQNSYFDTNLMARVTPKEEFDIKQNTKVSPVLTQGGELDSTATLDTSYKISGEIFTADNLLGRFKIGVDASYEKIPFSYKVKAIKNRDYNEFITKDIEYDEKTIKYNLIGVVKFNETTYFDIKAGEIKNEQVRPTGTITQKEKTITAGIEIWF